MALPKAIVIIESHSLDMVYGPAEMESISRLVEIVAPPQTRESIVNDPTVLRDVEVILGGWGMPVFTAALLDAAPRLRAIFYAGGAIGNATTQSACDRGIMITTAVDANSIPVAEFTVATTLFSLKHGWSLARRARALRTYPNRNEAPGAYRSTVGIISLGAIGRRVVRLLRNFDLHILAYDPFVSIQEAAALGVELAPLERIFAGADVVSLHTPELPATRGMITGRYLASMKQGATFINTARGSVVREEEMLDVLESRPDLQAVLDTVCIEPPPNTSRLYILENVMLTPHIAGSAGNECRRMAHYMIEELERYVSGQPLRWLVGQENLTLSAHRLASVIRSGVEPIQIDVGTGMLSNHKNSSAPLHVS